MGLFGDSDVAKVQKKLIKLTTTQCNQARQGYKDNAAIFSHTLSALTAQLSKNDFPMSEFLREVILNVSYRALCNKKGFQDIVDYTPLFTEVLSEYILIKKALEKWPYTVKT